MKLLAICGFGVGSSLMLKISIEKICKEIGVEAHVTNGDLASVKGESCDAIFTSKSLLANLQASTSYPIYGITNFIDKTEVRKAIEQFLEDRNH
ncbi:MAG: PTS sugar transporter subunit IIB [Brevinema sp.]